MWEGIILATVWLIAMAIQSIARQVGYEFKFITLVPLPAEQLGASGGALGGHKTSKQGASGADGIGKSKVPNGPTRSKNVPTPEARPTTGSPASAHGSKSKVVKRTLYGFRVAKGETLGKAKGMIKNMLKNCRELKLHGDYTVVEVVQATSNAPARVVIQVSERDWEAIVAQADKLPRHVSVTRPQKADTQPKPTAQAARGKTTVLAKKGENGQLSVDSVDLTGSEGALAAVPTTETALVPTEVVATPPGVPAVPGDEEVDDVEKRPCFICAEQRPKANIIGCEGVQDDGSKCGMWVHTRHMKGYPHRLWATITGTRDGLHWFCDKHEDQDTRTVEAKTADLKAAWDAYTAHYKERAEEPPNFAEIATAKYVYLSVEQEGGSSAAPSQ